MLMQRLSLHFLCVSLLAGIAPHFLFEVPPDAHTVRVEARRAGSDGCVRRIATDVKGKILISLAILPGAWSVTGEDERGNHYRATVDIADADPDAPAADHAPWVVMQRGYAPCPRRGCDQRSLR